MEVQVRFVVTRSNGARHPAKSLCAEVHNGEPVVVCWTGSNNLIIPMERVSDIACFFLKDDGA